MLRLMSIVSMRVLQPLGPHIGYTIDEVICPGWCQVKAKEIEPGSAASETISVKPFQHMGPCLKPSPSE